MSCIYFMFQHLQVGTGRLKSKQVWLGNMLAIVASPLKSRGLTRRATRSVPQCLRRRVLRGFWGLCSSTSGQRTEHALAHSTETVFLRDLVAGFACGYTACNSGHGETPCGGEHLFDSRLNKQTAI
jgi:hypothetical protein